MGIQGSMRGIAVRRRRNPLHARALRLIAGLRARQPATFVASAVASVVHTPHLIAYVRRPFAAQFNCYGVGLPAPCR